MNSLMFSVQGTGNFFGSRRLAAFAQRCFLRANHHSVWTLWRCLARSVVVGSSGAGPASRIRRNPAGNILEIPLHAQSNGNSGTPWVRETENEGVGIRHRTTSVGFYIGDPCIQTCSSVLHHVFCNHTSRRCECRREHPVNINNRQCVKASALGSHCAYHEVCVYSVAHSSCQSSKCRCIDGHEPDAESIKCTPKRAPAILDGTELTTMVSVIVALLLFMALFCLVLRLFSNGDRTADAGSPPPNAAVLSSVDGSLSGNGAAVGTTEGPASRRTFRNSVDIAGPR
ncbi:uncharacterized protein [Dermacentor albipictus]|uniref:uncharacterized protein isoform X3 n=1 Tax=Dermacentor albipictus TaxID=60249 RepID=UPI0038FC96FD